MITDEERREVSAELRALDVSYIGVNGRIIDSPKDAGLLLIRMLDVVFAHHDKLHYFPGFISARAVVELLFVMRKASKQEGDEAWGYDKVFVIGALAMFGLVALVIFGCFAVDAIMHLAVPQVAMINDMLEMVQQ